MFPCDIATSCDYFRDSIAKESFAAGHDVGCVDLRQKRICISFLKNVQMLPVMFIEVDV